MANTTEDFISDAIKDEIKYAISSALDDEIDRVLNNEDYFTPEFMAKIFLKWEDKKRAELFNILGINFINQSMLTKYMNDEGKSLIKNLFNWISFENIVKSKE